MKETSAACSIKNAGFKFISDSQTLNHDYFVQVVSSAMKAPWVTLLQIQLIAIFSHCLIKYGR